jgi:hypothetical protein
MPPVSIIIVTAMLLLTKGALIFKEGARVESGLDLGLFDSKCRLLEAAGLKFINLSLTAGRFMKGLT